MPYGYTNNIVYKDVLKHLHEDAAHETMNAPDIQFFLDHLSVGNAYEINKFRVIHNRRSGKVIPHAAIIELNRNTIIVPIHKTSQEHPMHWFNLIELDQLHQRINNDAELTNVFGCLTAVQPTEEVTIQNTRVAKKRNLNLQNIRDESVRITLWGETATNFENSGIQSLLPPVFVALTSLKVKQYQGKLVLGSTGSTVCVFNPEIPQLSKYKHKFKHLRSPVQILRTLVEMYIGHAVDANAESKTIDQLLLLDPALHKNVSFVCLATIVGFDLIRGWWYKSCLSCHKVVKNNSGSFEFKIDLIVEDNTNQHNFLMIGRHAEKILSVSCHTMVIEDGYKDPFTLSFGNQNTDFGKTDFVVHGLIQDEPHSSPTIALVTPQTPIPTAGKQILTKAIPNPFTPSQQLHQQPQPATSTKTSRRALFPDQTEKSDSKKPCSDQIETTNSARIAREFHNLVVPKIEPADKVPLAALKTKSQSKKPKDSTEDDHSKKK
ncbi:replication protein A 70 kDa DNA-binding subunit B-like [Pyrus ussuriensis x Pyrus communis]|uniref:Replication protein A 70 kDa DNA-binding subunit B-like n=1 Tax=Pyrus ussuriensis x Pyrus communis TaxID=2448454 RepID=A0A5N5I172_9ROSA|nr:replication protein A 70 kDa DNA-binding subunit B-like [Pyrus ussuriensis x Pyrus communis]